MHLSLHIAFLVVLSLCVVHSLPVPEQSVYTNKFCPEAPRTPQDRRTNKKALRVVEFNVEWLFLREPGDPANKRCPGTGCKWNNQTIAIEHLNEIAGFMKTMSADIVLFVELEDCYVLDYLISALPGMGYKSYVLKGTDTATGQNVGIMTRVDPLQDLERTADRVEYPVAGNKCDYNGGSGTYGVSKHVFTRFHLEGADVNIFLIGFHFLAFPTTPDRCAKREAQSLVIRGVIEKHAKEHPNDEIIAIGDYNDYSDLFFDTARNSPNSRVLKFIREAVNPHLYNVGLTQPSGGLETYSAWYDINGNCIDDGGQEHTMIDHVMISDGLRKALKKVKYDHMFVASCESLASDHWPIVVDFEF